MVDHTFFGKRMKISHIALIVSLVCFGKTVAAASFDCNKATTYIEQTICLTPELSTLDDQLNLLYKKTIQNNVENKSSLKQEQLSWLKNIRNKATSEQGIRDAYMNRISSLNIDLNKGVAIQEAGKKDQPQTAQTQIASLPTHAAYIKYAPGTHVKYLNAAITGPCMAEHQKFDSLDFNLKMNFSKMSDTQIAQETKELKNAERARWICIENELNKKNITLDLKSLFEKRDLGSIEAPVQPHLAQKQLDPVPFTQSKISKPVDVVVPDAGFYQQLDDFSQTSTAETLSAGLSQEELKQAAHEINEDIKNFINYTPSEYYSTLQYKNDDLASIARGRNDTKATTYFIAKDILAGKGTEFKAMQNLGVSYLYGRDALVKDDKKARLILGFVASNGYHYARYILSNDYLFRNNAASKSQLQYISRLMNNTPWYAEYEALKKAAEFRVANYNGYYIKVTCVANNTVKTPLNISKCAKPYTIHLKDDKGTGYDLSDHFAPVWRDYNGTSILYTPEHFSFSTKNGEGNTLLLVEVFKVGTLSPEKSYQLESYQEISFTL
ncbi:MULTISPECIES: lysozyme inhibitor LprI family protein [Enterobacteriaceae]|uniref:lysozyme inhibitor LprI family protein n=1 Tax=Enterobacteriaceae TaxID=543 RepID=UPI0007D6ECDD|nr:MULTISPECIES: lysozyme inhibitor LprI family protein [Enterobacteriaceae]ELI8802684.1 hypothetical protein [Klebsiella michiganensis]MBM3069710.1 hypothetical protein [Lelliottia sp. RWM.1]